MADKSTDRHEIWTTLKYSAVAGLGFLVDVSLLKLGIHAHLSPAIARSISLICSMQVTFAVNGFLVFRCFQRGGVRLMWLGYMASNAVGNLSNYLIFTTLLSLHRPLVSNPLFAVAIGGLVAWAINYASARFVFRKLKTLSILRSPFRTAEDDGVIDHPLVLPDRP